jgi:hypothetical protein
MITKGYHIRLLLLPILLFCSSCVEETDREGFTLPSSISGIVYVDGTLTAIKDAKVQLVRLEASEIPLDSDTSDVSGQFGFDNPGTADYGLRCSHIDYLPSDTNFVVSAGKKYTIVIYLTKK